MALTWQKLSVPVPALSWAGAEQGQEQTADEGCPWGIPGRAETQDLRLGLASQHWSRLSAISLEASLP